MQTFMPYPDPQRCAEVLDYRRLGKQRVEGYQILQTLVHENTGWKNHPAVKMWRGYEGALARYTLTMCEHWVRAYKYQDTTAQKIRDLVARHDLDLNQEFPPFVGDEDFHRAHRLVLVNKNWEHYFPIFREQDPLAEYIWPGEQHANS